MSFIGEFLKQTIYLGGPEAVVSFLNFFFLKWMEKLSIRAKEGGRIKRRNEIGRVEGSRGRMNF